MQVARAGVRVQVVIAGAGALGSVLGGYFARAGADVTLLGRRAHVEAVRRDGLRLDGIRGAQVIRNLRAVWDPAEISEVELLVIAVKAYDTAETLASLAHLRGRVGSAISIQNGIQKDEELAESLGAEAAVGAASIVGATMPEPGRVLHTGEGVTWIGELDGKRSARVEAIAMLFKQAELSIDVREDNRSVLWCKLNQYIPAGLLACVTRLPLHRIYLSRELAALFVEVSREAARVAERLGIPLVDLQGIPVKTLCALPEDQAVESIISRGRLMESRGMTGVRISILQDLERGRRTEADQVVGHVVRLAKTHGVSIPLLETLLRIVHGIEASSQSAAAVDIGRPA